MEENKYSVHFAGENAAYLSQSGSSVFMGSGMVANDFSNSVASPTIKELQTILNIAEWGEDNRFPQNIVKHIDNCGVAKAALNFKAKSYFGSGLIYGKTAINDKGESIFIEAKKGDYPEVDLFWQRTNIPRYFIETGTDFAYFVNTFTEAIFDKGFKKITRLVNQEACDCRFEKMDAMGKIKHVFISKLWGLTEDNYVKFDPKKKIKGIVSNSTQLPTNEFIAKRFCVDMYNPQDSLKEAVEKKQKTVIIPVNYPSPNKTYYQLAPWDGVRLSGWIEIASKVPSMIKALYNNGMTLRYHIELPDTYFPTRAGLDKWDNWDEEEKKKFVKDTLKKMDEFLTGDENAFKSFTSSFEINKITGSEIGRVKITPIKSESNIDKDLMTSGTANSEIFFAMEINPNILGAGQPGGVYSSNQGGSNIREGYITHTTNIHLERQLLLEPFYIVKEFNQWPDELEFRFKDTLLTTLDTHSQTETKTR